MFLSHLYIFLGKFLFRSLAHFLIWSLIFLELSCRSCLYICDINSLSVASFAIIFSHSEGCLFTLLIVSFVVQKLSSLIRSHLFIFAFISHTLGGGQGIFPTQGLNPSLPHCGQTLYHLSHQGSPSKINVLSYLTNKKTKVL